MTDVALPALEPEVEEVAPSRRQVLIIDDDAAMAEVLSVRLARQGLDALSAVRGKTGLELARHERPAVILLDLVLPDDDGLRLCRELTDAPETWSIPVIVLTGLDRPDLLQRCRQAGARFFLRKPYDPNALLVLIQHALDESVVW